jgi:hypothetical protein
MYLSIVPKPLRWISVTRIHILDGYGEMHKVKVKIFQTPIRELLFCHGFDLDQTVSASRCTHCRVTYMIVSMECVPELE